MATQDLVKLGGISFCLIFGPYAMMQAAAILRGAVLTWNQSFMLLSLGGGMFLCCFVIAAIVVASERRGR